MFERLCESTSVVGSMCFEQESGCFAKFAALITEHSAQAPGRQPPAGGMRRTDEALIIRHDCRDKS